MSIVSTISPNGKRVEAEASVENVDSVLDALETGKQVRTRVKAEKQAKAVMDVVETIEKKLTVKKAAKTSEIEPRSETKQGSSKGKSNERIQRAFEVIKELKAQDVSNKDIIKALMNEFKLEKSQQAVCWYYVNKAFPKAFPNG